MKRNRLSTLMLAGAAAGWSLAGLALAEDSELYYLVHKATGAKASTCGPYNSEVSMATADTTNSCVQWEVVPKGDYFYLRSVGSDGYIRPRGLSNGIPIKVHETSWTGSYTQWSFEDTGDGYGYMVNRQTKKYMYSSGEMLEQESKNWKGDWTRWKLEPVNNVIEPPVDQEEVTVASSILVGGADSIKPGFTLYTFDNDKGSNGSVCNSGCATAWPPVLVTDGTASGANDLGTIVRNNGDIQATYKGSPLYFYASDNNPGDSSGDSISGWHSVNIDGGMGGGGSEEPKLNITSPANNASIKEGKVVFINFTSELENGAYVQYSINGAAPVAYESSDAIQLSGLDAGEYSVVLEVVDAGGSPTGVRDTVSFEVTAGAASAGAGDFGLQFVSSTSALIRHLDKPFTAGFSNLCFQGACAPATLNNGYWERLVDGLTLGQTYNIGTQIQDNDIGQCGININVVFQEAGDFQSSSCLPPDTEAPSQVVGLEGEERNGRAAALNWNAATDNRAVAEYLIYRDGSYINSTSETSYNDSDLTENTTYTYSVEACDAADNCGAMSTTISVATGRFVPDETPPRKPAAPTAETVSQTEIDISWDAAFDEHGVVDRYELRRDGEVIATLTETTFSDSELRMATVYNYAIRARDNSGNWSQWSANAQAETDRPDFSHLDYTTNAHTGDTAGPAPRADRPAALATPENGAQATELGFAFDINGNKLTWRWGASNRPVGSGYFPHTRTAGDSDLEMHCSEDGGLTFTSAKLSNSTLTIPCTSNDYVYFFRYKHPLALNDIPGTDWIYTALFTIAERVNVLSYKPFTDGSSNWMRWRHPVAHDGCTAAVSDACHNNSLLRVLDRYNIWVDDSPGDVQLNHDAQSVLRIEALRWHGGSHNGQQQFVYNSNTCCGNSFSYGQVIQFEITALAGSQVYNDFSYYTVGLGWGHYGDPRLSMAGRAGTTMILSDNSASKTPGSPNYMEYAAVFTQPLVTTHSAEMINDWVLGHHLFHGVVPSKYNGPLDDPDAQIGAFTCGACHVRDGRGFEAVQTPKGMRLPPPVYGTKLLEVMEGRETGFTWDGGADSVEDQIKNALRDDHGVNWTHLPPEVFRLIVHYNELLTVPDRHPGVMDDPQIVRGEQLFREDVGCARCHVQNQRTRSDAPTHLRNISISPYTDMKLHNIGTGDETYKEWRTPPLWGLSHNVKVLEKMGHEGMLFMHDARASSVIEAVQQHGVDAQPERTRFDALSQEDKEALQAFVMSL